MKRLIFVVGTTLLVGLISALVCVPANRYETLAQSDLKQFAASNRSELYAFYPQLLDKIADNPVLAARVETVHLTVSDFASTEYRGLDFRCLSRFPNLTTIVCTYSHNLDRLVPTLNLLPKLQSLEFHHCDPIITSLEKLHSDSLRTLAIHSSTAIELPEGLADSCSQSIPNCKITFTTD
jgi:hypothetical protein